MFRVRSENFSSSAEQSADSRCGPVFSHRVLGECGILNGTMIKWNWQQQARIIYRGPEKARKRVLSCPALCFSNLTLSWKSSSRVLSMTPSGGGDCLFFFFFFSSSARRDTCVSSICARIVSAGSRGRTRGKFRFDAR